MAEIDGWRDRNCLAYRKDDKAIKPQYAVERLYELTKGPDTFITTEVGQHQMWAAQYYRFEDPNRWMTSGGLGTMGYGIPAAVGVQVANPKGLVIDIAGSLGHDDHARIIDRCAASSAHQNLHFEQ